MLKIKQFIQQKRQFSVLKMDGNDIKTVNRLSDNRIFHIDKFFIRPIIISIGGIDFDFFVSIISFKEDLINVECECLLFECTSDKDEKRRTFHKTFEINLIEKEVKKLEQAKELC